MQFRRAARLSSDSIVNHGASGMSVTANISSLARENSTHFSRDLRSIGLSFQRFRGSLARSWKRRSCSPSLTENQYLSRMIPERTSIRSNSGHARSHSACCSGVQNPSTRSTPPRLYQERSRITISPAAGRWAT